MIRIPSLLLCLLVISGLQAQNDYRFAFYNVENLFHPSDDSLVNDAEFTPEGKKNWSFYRYHQKLNKTAKVCIAMSTEKPIALLGMAELENELVLQDLIKGEVLANYNYQYVHYNSPDRRGIDVGLIYDKDQLTLIYSEAFRLCIPEDSSFISRDVLFSQFTTIGGDSLDVFICHWPSRYGGQEASEYKRLGAAALVRGKVDSLMLKGRTNILILGDLNDEPSNKSVDEILMAKKEISQPTQLLNLMLSLDLSEGSHRYKGQWAYLDQVIISQNLSDKVRNFGCFRASFLLEEDNRYPGQQPFRTYKGLRYNEGFSDHLPVFVDLNLN
jgi:predicted extracellular nuclease